MIRAAQGGDEEAFKQLYHQSVDGLYAYAMYKLGNKQDAEDVVAEVFARAVKALSEFKPRRGSSFGGWVFQIGRNLITDRYRRKEELLEPPEMKADGNTPEQMIIRKEVDDRVRGAMRGLSPRRQEIISLRYFGGLRNREIAKLLGLDERTVASHLTRGLKDMQERLEGEMTDE